MSLLLLSCSQTTKPLRRYMKLSVIRLLVELLKDGNLYEVSLSTHSNLIVRVVQIN